MSIILFSTCDEDFWDLYSNDEILFLGISDDTSLLINSAANAGLSFWKVNSLGWMESRGYLNEICFGILNRYLGSNSTSKSNGLNYKITSGLLAVLGLLGTWFDIDLVKLISSSILFIS